MRKLLRLVSTVTLALAAAGCSMGGGAGDEGSGGVSGAIASAHWIADTYVSGDISVTRSLEIDAGVTVTFASGTGLFIGSDATLRAVGSSEKGKGIVFTGRTASTRWRQIRFDGGSAGNAMTYCTVSGAGSDAGYAVLLDTGAVADIEYCTIAGNAAGGVDARSSGSGTVIKHDRIYGNALYPVAMNDKVSCDATNAFAAAGAAADLSSAYNAVLYYGDIAAADSVVFDIAEIPYQVADTFFVEDGGSLSVKAGATVRLGSDDYIQVHANGSFSAVGTDGAPVLFTGTSSATRWRQILFDDDSADNAMRYCELRQAGAEGHYAILFDPGASGSIENCTISGNAAGGIDAISAGGGTEISGCSFTGNGTTASGPYDIVTVWSDGGTLKANAGVSLSNNSCEQELTSVSP